MIYLQLIQLEKNKKKIIYTNEIDLKLLKK